MADLVGMVVERLQDAPTVGVPVYSRKPPHKVDGTGEAYLVVRDIGPWGGRNISGRQRRVIAVDLYSDCERDETGLPLADDATRRAWSIWAGVDKALHDTEHEWTAMCSSYRADEPSEDEVPGAEHSALLSGTYEVSA